MLDKLPPADVVVNTSTKMGGDVRIDVSVSRGGASSRSFSGEGANVSEAERDLLKKVFDEPASAEYIRRS